MAYRITENPVTLINLQGHSPTACLFKYDLWGIWKYFN